MPGLSKVKPVTSCPCSTRQQIGTEGGDILTLNPESEVASSEATGADTLAGALLRVAGGDRDAFEEVYRRTATKLFGVCLQILANRAEAEEALQDLYCTVWQRASVFDPQCGSAMTWLITVARNRSVDQLRRSKPARLKPIDHASAMADPRPLAFDTIAADHEHNRMRHCLDLLSARDASALRAAFFDGATYADLAQAACVPIGTMKSRIRRALLRLRNGMTDA